MIYVSSHIAAKRIKEQLNQPVKANNQHYSQSEVSQNTSMNKGEKLYLIISLSILGLVMLFAVFMCIDAIFGLKIILK